GHSRLPGHVAPGPRRCLRRAPGSQGAMVQAAGLLGLLSPHERDQRPGNPARQRRLRIDGPPGRRGPQDPAGAEAVRARAPHVRRLSPGRPGLPAGRTRGRQAEVHAAGPDQPGRRIAGTSESPAQTYARYLRLPPWPGPWVLRAGFALEHSRALGQRLDAGTSLFAVARRPWGHPPLGLLESAAFGQEANGDVQGVIRLMTRQMTFKEVEAVVDLPDQSSPPGDQKHGPLARIT